MIEIFDTELELPNEEIGARTSTLIGFQERYNRISSNLRLLLDRQKIIEWSRKHYKKDISLLKFINEKYPLIIMAGDAGTGKTVNAESIADMIIRETKKEGYFLRLSTRVRGEGLHGQEGNLVNDAFSSLIDKAGKKRIAFLMVDEADAIATSRSTIQMHQEEKAAVNTLIQKLDEIRSLDGRAIVFMATNRLHLIDEAIIRRASIVMKFERPSESERFDFFKMTFDGINLNEDQIKYLSSLTGKERTPNNLDYSYSDLRLRLIPEIISSAYMQDVDISYDLIMDTIKKIEPSPEIK